MEELLGATVGAESLIRAESIIFLRSAAVFTLLEWNFRFCFHSMKLYGLLRYQNQNQPEKIILSTGTFNYHKEKKFSKLKQKISPPPPPPPYDSGTPNFFPRSA